MSLSFPYSQSSECFHNCTYFVIVCLLIKTNVLKWYTQLCNKCLAQLRATAYNESHYDEWGTQQQKRITLRVRVSEKRIKWVYFMLQQKFLICVLSLTIFLLFFIIMSAFLHYNTNISNFFFPTLFHSIKQQLFASFSDETSFILNYFTRIRSHCEDNFLCIVLGLRCLGAVNTTMSVALN